MPGKKVVKEFGAGEIAQGKKTSYSVKTYDLNVQQIQAMENEMIKLQECIMGIEEERKKLIMQEVRYKGFSINYGKQCRAQRKVNAKLHTVSCRMHDKILVILQKIDDYIEKNKQEFPELEG